MREEFQRDEVQDNSTARDAEPFGPSAGTEDLALAQFKNRDLPLVDIETIARNTGLMKSRKLRMAVASHPHAPRRIALRLVREFYAFELMQFALIPSAPADLRRVADELLLSRLCSITLGERISLARRASERVAGGLLLDKEIPVWQAALENPRLTEAAIAKALQRPIATPAFVVAISHHSKWCLRREIRIALLRNAHTPLSRAIEFAQRLQPPQIRDILHASRLPEEVKQYLRKSIGELSKQPASRTILKAE